MGGGLIGAMNSVIASDSEAIQATPLRSQDRSLRAALAAAIAYAGGLQGVRDLIGRQRRDQAAARTVGSDPWRCVMRKSRDLENLPCFQRFA
jgi:hypothetical protein